MLIRYTGLLTALLLGASSPSTTHTLSVVAHKNKPRSSIDRITTAAQAQQFVTSSSENYRNFVLEEAPKQEKGEFMIKGRGDDQTNCVELSKCVNIKAPKNWVKADFDGNGQTDLLVYGRFHRQAEPISVCLLDVAPNQLQSQVLSKRNVVCRLLTVIQVQGKPAVQRAQLTYTQQKEPYKLLGPFCQLDTIIHNKTGFIEYNSRPKDYKIQRVELAVSKCYGRCPVYTIEINSNLAVKYQAIAYNKKQGSFISSLDRNTVQSLYSLLSYVRFPSLEDNTRRVNIDDSTYTLTITYAGGKQKIIGDELYTEHLGLQQVYKLLADIKNQQDSK